MEVDARLLLPFVPAETELDCWDGKVFVSLVGFSISSNQNVGWVAIPMHSKFEESESAILCAEAGGERGTTRSGIHSRKPFRAGRLL